MLYKHPELFWALFLLLIPILIHLFQLRKYRNTPFTNVKLLQKVVSQTRKSSILKKWLLLFTRLLILLGLILAFTQPYLANKAINFEKEMVIYLDNSFSMQARSNNITSLENAIQELINSVPEDMVFSLFTNDELFPEATMKGLRDRLLSLNYTPEQLDINEIMLKGKNLFSKSDNTIKNLVLVSDFQNRSEETLLDSKDSISLHIAQMRVEDLINVSIDSVYLKEINLSTLELWVKISSNNSIGSTPVSLFNEDILIAKTAAKFDDSNNSEVVFTLPANESIQGTIQILDAGLAYDNEYFFTINKKERIKVLSIGDEDAEFLNRIFTNDEFIFKNTNLKNLNYSELANQNLLVLNELKSLSNSLVKAIKAFLNEGGNLIVIPAMDGNLVDYNGLTADILSTNYLTPILEERSITTINFEHPLYKNVFTKNVQNFQFPKVNGHFKIKSNAAPILSLQDGSPFLIGDNGVYLFTAPISGENSNFKSSPLIVPTLYSIGTNSLQLSKLFFRIGQNSEVDVQASLGQDNVLKVLNTDFEFIPNQVRYANRTSLKFFENPKKDGIYAVSNGEKTYQYLAFNYSREESDLVYTNMDLLQNGFVKPNLSEIFKNIEKDLSITELWKWFIIFAMIFMLCEVLIQKFIK
ncbi:MAG: BatA domain-containing protein [Eudoraea sp.]|uniref:BatA domain-containing protein n=1 Tax=Eudoraea sp. TaxID=1979955 RepID=UPI003C748982